MRIKHFSRIRWIDFFKSNIILVFHYFLFLASFIVGVLSVLFDFTIFDSTYLAELFNSEVLADYWTVFKYCFLICFVIVSAVYFLSFYPFGAPLTVIVYISFSFIVGFIATSICNLFGFSGLAFNVVSFVIPTIIFAIVFSLISSASVSFSTNVATMIFKNKSIVEFRQKTKDVFILYLILTVIVVLNSLLASFLIMIISGIITV